MHVMLTTMPIADIETKEGLHYHNIIDTVVCSDDHKLDKILDH